MPFKISSAIVSTFELPICWICRYSFQINKSSDPAYPLSFFPFFFFFFFVAITRPSIHPSPNIPVVHRTDHIAPYLMEHPPSLYCASLFLFSGLFLSSKVIVPTLQMSLSQIPVPVSNPVGGCMWLLQYPPYPTANLLLLPMYTSCIFVHTPTGVTHRRPRDFRS